MAGFSTAASIAHGAGQTGSTIRGDKVSERGAAVGERNATTAEKQQALEQRKQDMAEYWAPKQMEQNEKMAKYQMIGGLASGVGSIFSGLGGLSGLKDFFSDERLKDVIAPAEELNPIELWAERLTPFYYNYKPESGMDPNLTHLGISAQELSQLPGVTSVEEDESGFLVVDPSQQCLVNTAVIASLCKALVNTNLQLQFIMEQLSQLLEPTSETIEPAQQLQSGGKVVRRKKIV